MTDLYDFVGDRIREFCDKTYYADIVCSFEQSYDGKEWTKEVEFANFENGTDLYYENDWNEGQTHIRNLRIWHLEDSEPIVRCKECFVQKTCRFAQFLGNEGYCSQGERQ